MDVGGDDNKRADGKPEVNGGQLHTMFTSSVGVQSVIDFSDLGKHDKFTLHKLHVEGWGARDFEGHAPVAMHNTTGWTVPLTCILLNIQSTV